MNDIFIEQLVKKKRTVKDNIIFIFTILTVILVPVVLASLAVTEVLTAYFIYISFFVLLIGIWSIWMVYSNQKVEFEYQMVQDTLVVSKIIDKRKRKHILKIDVKQFDKLGKANDEEIANAKYMKVFDACADASDKINTYYAVYQNAGLGKCALRFTPDEKIMNSMKPYLKKDIVLKLFYNR